MDQEELNNTKAPNSRRTTTIGVVLGIILLALISTVVFQTVKINKVSAESEQLKEDNEQLQLTNEQMQLANEYQALDLEFKQYENQQQMLTNDSIVEKYAAAKLKVEKLLKELNDEKTKSAQRIQELQAEITTLKGILRHYVEQIDTLNKENAGLRAENAEIKNRNAELSSTVASVSKKNEVLSERMTLAEKLNVTGVSLAGLKKNGKAEKNITKAKQLMVSFTIPQNNSTPVGEKTIYLRITTPEGTLLGNGGTFTFEGADLKYTARKSVEYSGEEISGVCIYWDINTALNPGEYTVELFADNFRLVSRKFTLTK